MAVSSDMLAAFLKVADGASVSRAALELGAGSGRIAGALAKDGVRVTLRSPPRS